MNPTLRMVSDAPPPMAPADPLIGQTLEGRYLIEGVLGEGGMGLVYKARHVILGKRLAIKVLKAAVSRDEQVIERFRREAQSASAIGSPHIIDISDFGTMPDGATYFVMEFLDGLSLTQAMERERPMRPERIVKWAKQVCEALGQAHERGIVHRDLKPDNVYLVPQGSERDFVKILDFGIAKVGSVADKKLTQAGQVFGTPHYMSPEQCAGREVDHRTDIYALGVMLYEAACGQVPFDSDSLMGVLTKHVYEAPIPPRQLPTPVDVLPGLEAVILRCLAKTADQRYQNMAELYSDLSRIENGSTPDAIPPSIAMRSSSDGSMPALHMAPSHAQLAETKPKSRVGLVVLGVLGILVAAGAAFTVAFVLPGMGTGARPEPPPIAQHPDPLPVPDPVPVPEVDPVPTPDPAPPVPTVPTAPARTHVHLVTDPAGALVLRNGELIGNTPTDVPLPEAGATVEIIVRLNGYHERQFRLSPLSAAELTIPLDRVGRPRRQVPIASNPVPTPQPFGGGQPTPPPPPQPRHNSVSSDIIDPFAQGVR